MVGEHIRRSNYDEYFGRRIHHYVRFSPNGKLLACIADKRQIKILDATTGEFMRVLSAAEKDTSRPESAGVGRSRPESAGVGR